MDGSISYSYDKLHLAMKTNICELFSSITETVALAIDLGCKIEKSNLQEFHDNLISFGEEFKVERSKTIAAMVKEEIDMK